MVQQIYENHRLSVVINYLLTYSLLQLTFYVALIAAYYRQEPPVLLCCFCSSRAGEPCNAFVAANGLGAIHTSMLSWLLRWA
jgi:hypothetical protein